MIGKAIIKLAYKISFFFQYEIQILKMESDDYNTYFNFSDQDFNPNYNTQGYNSSICDLNWISQSNYQMEFNNNHQHGNCSFKKHAYISPTKRKRILNKYQRAEATKRERRRMFRLNEAFENLRQALPISELTKAKLSRIETLKFAIEYIDSMINFLNDIDSTNNRDIHY